MRRPPLFTALITVVSLGASPPAANAVEHLVSVADFSFTPKTLTVAPGDTVRWTNAGGGHQHNVVADDRSFRCANGCQESGGSGEPDDGAWTFTLAFPEAGEFPYHCAVHGGPGGIGMSGTVVVVGATPGCVADATTLCLGDGRFRIQAHWQTGDGQSGPGHAVMLTSDTGYFWFFSESNVEEVVKVLDGCAFNQRKWVFAGGLTNVHVELTVIDTATGAPKSYVNPQNTKFQPIQDTDAFATCP